MLSLHKFGPLIAIIGCLSFHTGCQTMQAAWKREISLEYVSKQALTLSKKPFKDDWGRLPNVLDALDYDDYRKIEYRADRALWATASDKLHIRFFHPGGAFKQAVKINEFTESHVQPIRFVSGFFDYNKIPELEGKVPSSLGYAGFSAYSPLTDDDTLREYAVFLGSNYFRMVGADQHWGISARALAINTGTGSQEEFPTFREFWLKKPTGNSKSLQIFALLDSPSASGAFEFNIQPGTETRVNVKSEIYFRKRVERAGLAPISSMFYFGENSIVKPTDFRPEVHDSDGLLIHYPDSTEWRPLANPTAYRSQEIPGHNIVKYGLLQRDQEFDNFEDIEAQYHRRPSVMVTPIHMPNGNLILHEFHSDNEYNDNVALFWSLGQPIQTGIAYRSEYELTFFRNSTSTKGFVSSTRIGKTIRDSEEYYQVVVDFSGENIETLDRYESLEAEIDTGTGIELIESVLVKNPFNQKWRLTMLLDIPESHFGSKISAVIVKDQELLTERWHYQWIK